MINLLCSALLAAGAATASSIPGVKTFEAQGSDSWSPLSPDDEIVKQQGLEVTKRARAKSGTDIALAAAKEQALALAFEWLVTELDTEHRALVDDNRQAFDRLMSPDLREHSKLLKSFSVLKSSTDPEKCEAHVRISAQIYAKDLFKRMMENADRLHAWTGGGVVLLTDGLDLTQLLSNALSTFNIPTVAGPESLNEKRTQPSLRAYAQSHRAELTALIRDKKASALLLAVREQSRPNVIKNAPLPALEGQTNLTITLRILAVAADGTVIEEQMLMTRGLGTTAERATERALKSLVRVPPPDELVKIVDALKK